ncbi:glycosyltransferase [Caulobacter soli]|uniref:glycosyltransferase n=1 Tax=Caulobacter soli TaxID=2708539 RepID=UPI0013EA8BB4|nr:glycosyltransferase [Caulobacter soli]
MDSFGASRPDPGGADAPLRILLIARHFPPHVSGGARRPYLLARALNALGAQVRVIAPGLPAGIAGVVAPLLHAPEVSGVAGPAVKASLSARLRSWARWLLLWPDADIRWARRAVRAAEGLGDFRPDWVITTSPPESIHCAGPALARRYGARWAADMRDEWLTRPFRPELAHPLRRWIETIIARDLLRRADLITCVDDVVAREARQLAPKGVVAVLSQFAAPPPPPAELPTDRVHVFYTGSVSLSDPFCDVEALRTAVATASAARPDLLFHFVGRLTPGEAEVLGSAGPPGAVRLYGAVDYETTRTLQAAADAFLVTAARDATAIPGKVYEYRAVGAPIIAAGEGPWRALGGYDPGDAAERLVKLVKRRPGDRVGPGIDTPEDAARRLLALMASVSDPRRTSPTS